MSYIVLRSFDSKDLEEKVNKKVAEGYTPICGFSNTSLNIAGNIQIEYCQPMFKEEEGIEVKNEDLASMEKQTSSVGRKKKASTPK